jgi:hypothetical protein
MRMSRCPCFRKNLGAEPLRETPGREVMKNISNHMDCFIASLMELMPNSKANPSPLVT